MSRNGLYVLVGVLVVALVGLGIYLYQEQNRPGVEIRVNDNGLSIEGNS